MTPQAKAYEIWQKMMNADALIDSISAKQCSLVAVDEIIKAVEGKYDDYWKEVKQEIKNL
jgi:hypothetical protein